MSGNVCLQRRPFGLRFLHAVFAEDTLAGLDDRADIGGLEGLRDRDERHRTGFAPGLTLRGGDPRLDREKLFDGARHAYILPF